MKVGFVYTSTTPELTCLLQEEASKQLGGKVTIMNYENPDILAEVRDHGFVTPHAASALLQMYLRAADEGADAILNICSSVGEVADCAQDMARYIGVPLVRIDEDMCREAVRLGSRVAVIATLPTTLTPTRNTILRVAREMGKQVTLVDGLVDGAFGLDQAGFQALLLEMALKLKDSADVMLLCQGSMAYCEHYLEEQIGKPVVSSPRFGIAALRKALEAKGFSF